MPGEFQTPMNSADESLAGLVGHTVVVDVVAPFVYVGTFTSSSEQFLELTDADVHDLRDSDGTRELYVLHSARDGVRRNRRRVLLRWEQVLSVSKLEDVVDH